MTGQLDSEFAMLWSHMLLANPKFTDRERREFRHMFFQGVIALMKLNQDVGARACVEEMHEMWMSIREEVAAFQADLKTRKNAVTH